MQNQWKGILLLAAIAAVSALAGGVLHAVMSSGGSSASETTPDADRTASSDVDSADPRPNRSRDAKPNDKADKGNQGDSPMNALFGGGGGKSRPDVLAEFHIAEGAKRLAYANASSGLPTVGEWRGRPALGDMDGDGNLDIVCSVRKGDGLHVYYGDGKGNWSERGEPFPSNLGYGGSDIGDFNNDGFLDIVFATHGAPAMIYLGDGAAGFTKSIEGCENRQILQDVTVNDFDGDGNADIAAIGWAHGGRVMIYGDGTGKWETVDLFPGDDEEFGHEIESGDVDGDGNMDIVVTMGGPKVFLGDGQRGFRPANRALPVPLTTGTNFGIAVGDVTGDGTLEMAVCFTAMEGMRGLAVYDQEENGAWTSISMGLPLDTSFIDAEFADMDGDGVLDLVAFANHNLLIWRGDGGKTWTPIGQVGDMGKAADLAVGDLNGDGQQDVVVIQRHGVAGVAALLKR